MKKTLFFLFLLTATKLLFAQEVPPFWKEIAAFKKTDSTQPPPKKAVLLVGSSSFALWKDVQDYFPGYTIINRGFGGSTLVDVIRYAYDVILPYQPKQVIIYCGENDLASPDKPTAEAVVLRFKTLYGIIRQNLPLASIHFVSLKPSPSRQHLFPQMKKVNAAVKAFLQTEKRTGFINVFDAMLDASGNPKKEIFREDLLHMNASGYAIWKKIMQPYLLK